MTTMFQAALLGLSVSLALASPASAHASDLDQAIVSSADTPDPVLLEKARISAAVIIPDGSIEAMFGPMMDQMIEPMIDQMAALPVRELARIGGLDETKLDTLGDGKLRDIMAIIDPAFRERSSLITRTMFAEMGPLMGALEPDMREGMAEAFANRYSAAELDEINRFLASSTGRRFGNGFMQLATDPAYLKKMQAMMPRIIDAMPAIAQKAFAAAASLPAPRNWNDLTDAERAQLSAIMGGDTKDSM